MAEATIEMDDDEMNGKSQISREKFEVMRMALDADGDGSVTKEEFMLAWSKLFPNLSDEQKEEIWVKMDTDKSNTLETQELAAYFGFDWEADAAVEMTDDQILGTLEIQSSMDTMLTPRGKPKEEEKKPELTDAEKKKKEEEKKKKAESARDQTLKQIMLEQSKDKKKDEDAETIELRNMFEAATLGDLEEPKDPKEKEEGMYLAKYVVQKGCNVRVEDEKGEMLLHKLARVQVTDKNKNIYRQCFSSIIKLMREQAGAAGKKSIVTDVNHQDKAGKTPLFMAVEHKNHEMINLLYTLKVDGPDSILVNAQGWTVLHSAVNTDHLETLRVLTTHFTPARLKVLLMTADRTGREPLHIAAYKCTEEVVDFLMKLGASNKKEDTAGNNAAKLAERAGRRKSRDIIDGKALAEVAKLNAAAGQDEATA